VALQFAWELALKKNCCGMFGHSGDNSASAHGASHREMNILMLSPSQLTPSSYLDSLDFLHVRHGSEQKVDFWSLSWVFINR